MEDNWHYEVTESDLEEIKTIGEEKFLSSYSLQEKFVISKRGFGI